MTCALMVSPLRLSAYFTITSVSNLLFIFETSNLSDRIDFIMFPVTNEKQRSSVALATRRFL